ncbi:MAG: hypoxanthine phosphoribosyltransferase [Deltaproteobacteria bacterium]|jgi:hypoxanthine phosphoribosyltransferase
MIGKEQTVLLSEEAIRNRVKELGRIISADYAGADEVLLIGVLRGCFIFLADLCRELTVPSCVDFIAVSSYEDKTTPGCVKLIMDNRIDVTGKHVLIIDDILDSGHTMLYLRKHFGARDPASLKTCVLLRKPEGLEEGVQIDYFGFDIPDLWVFGYGLDNIGRLRNLPYIGCVKT